MKIKPYFIYLNILEQIPLNKDSFVVDCGGYLGKFTETVVEKVDCNVWIVEPLSEYASHCRKLFAGNRKVKISPFGLGNKNEKSFLYANKDVSSFDKKWAKSNKKRQIQIYKASEFLHGMNCDLLALNCEGAEHDIIPDLYENNELAHIKNVVVQWHKTKNASDKAREMLKEVYNTHMVINHHELWTNK